MEWWWVVALAAVVITPAVIKIRKRRKKRLAAQQELPELEMEGDEEFVYYFAYGAMMNDSAWERRSVTRLESKPAFVRDFQLAFTMYGVWPVEPAFADLRPKKGAVAHGVMHKLSREDMMVLWHFERRYKVLHARGFFYGGTEVPCLVFSAYRPMEKEGSPSRRYLNIITEGARHYGVDEDYRRQLEARPTSGIPIPTWAFHLGDVIMKLLF